ncbi:MAG: bacterial Ig-like domain-containing protein [Lachnospiraceae bacterium]|nr:bacterial Ig-like domain-containing protein [Lachnospiraceae bacterium]
MKNLQIKHEKKGVLRTILGVVLAAGMALSMMACGGGKESAKTLSEVQMMTPVEKTTYLVGETFDTTGLTLVGVYSDGSRSKVTDFSVDKTGPLTKEDTAVTITAGDFTFTQEIKVITPAEQVVMIPNNGVDTLEMFADGHIAVVGGAGTGSLEPDETYWSWDGETLRIWLTVYTEPSGPKEDHKTEMELHKNEVGDITFEYDVRGRWHMNYLLPASAMEGVLTPEARYPITE